MMDATWEDRQRGGADVKYPRGVDVIQALQALFGIEGPLIGITVEATTSGPAKITLQRYAASTQALADMRGEFLARVAASQARTLEAREGE